MPNFTCCTCGAQYAPSEHPPASCIICADDRQYDGLQGQEWTTREELILRGAHIVSNEMEPGVRSLAVEPKLGIGQQAFLIQTPEGNILWDCLGLLHPDFVRDVQALGGLRAIAISHPHFYNACVDFAEALECKVILPEADKQWVTRPSPYLEFWSGDSKQLWEGLELIRLGGHFPGSSVLLWQGGAGGKGALFTGDTLYVTPDRGWVSWAYSFPNMLPLPPQQVSRIAGRLRPYSFERMYGHFPHATISEGAAEAVQRSAARYCGLLEGSVYKVYY